MRSYTKKSERVKERKMVNNDKKKSQILNPQDSVLAPLKLMSIINWLLGELNEENSYPNF